MSQPLHQSVLLSQAVGALQIRADGCYVDATFGRGGHSRAILEQLGAEGRLLALDQDQQACRYAEHHFGGDNRFTIIHAPFSRLGEELTRRRVGAVNGILVDLGVSSPQLDEIDRGFSWRGEAPLDMRMDPSRGESAAAWLAIATWSDIAKVLKEYGEERYANRIARAIVSYRESEGPIETTTLLAKIIAAAHPRWERDRHPATRSFQAIRIYINGELEQLEQLLSQLLALLAEGARVVMISFHSLEDRLVKRFMRQAARGDDYPPDLPIPVSALKPKLKIIGKAVRPQADEIAANPRSRSAIMRVAQRLVA
ncbi:16S rRNA (cytosine(1402)-N(4))-methyltransferase RsmH [Ectothiorhodospiraceae bacterium BW-2]|nr:16S rRNA (cytosine(1402)-N(4))-methyltransferase RsmH [Ectothiorhodospiraceae bacterium BW-2]